MQLRHLKSNKSFKNDLKNEDSTVVPVYCELHSNYCGSLPLKKKKFRPCLLPLFDLIATRFQTFA